MRTAFHELLAGTAGATPDSPSLTFGNETISYGELLQLARRAAAGLQSLGLGRGDRIAIYLEKRIETVAAMFAASIADGIFVPINHLLKPAQVAHIVTDSGARVLITSGYRLAQLAGVLPGSPVEHVVLVDDPPVATPASIAVHSWAGGPSHAEPSGSRAIDTDPAAILYTSGSTGKPKGVVLSHRNLIVGAESVSGYLGNTSEDVILSVLPLSFDAGLSQITTSFAVGAHCILLNYLLPREVPRLCELHAVTGITAVPPLWFQLADLPWPEAASARIRYFANTGGRLPQATLDRLRAIFPCAEPFLMYGLTEAFRSTYLDPAEVDRRPGSIGKAIPNAEVLVLRPDGTECGPGEEGELVHRGALVSLGYWNDPVNTAERYRPVVRPGQEGWLPEPAVWSGDTVRRDEDGFLYFVGRRDEMIKTSGYRVSPTELEEAAFTTGLVKDAVAIGVDDTVLGQRIVLVATPARPDLVPEEVVTALRQLLPLYMVPASVELRDELPRSPNGKFDRPLIRSQLTA